MDRNIVFLTLSLISVYFLIDDFIGKKRITNLVEGWIGVGTSIPESSSTNSVPWIDPAQADKSKTEAKKQIDQNPKMSQAEKDFMKQNIDHFYGDVSVH
jgi:hypothetical protein